MSPPDIKPEQDIEAAAANETTAKNSTSPIPSVHEPSPNLVHSHPECRIAVLDYDSSNLHKWEHSKESFITFLKSEPRSRWVKSRWINVMSWDDDVMKALAAEQASKNGLGEDDRLDTEDDKSGTEENSNVGQAVDCTFLNWLRKRFKSIWLGSDVGRGNALGRPPRLPTLQRNHSWFNEAITLFCRSSQYPEVLSKAELCNTG
ncbi:hypothetical protein B0O99DRAFT_593908 [Bisporella sp. PMI_857]|nr:hypothetical protein B0O99DRAFT_593908 [Bisporella sp. PMI_857]